jgi:hypothetical protein
MPRMVTMMNITAKKKSSDTGAKKAICPASGPGWSFSGMSMPMWKPDSRFA